MDMKKDTAVKKSIRPMPRPTEKRMGALRERAKEAAETERLEGLIGGGTDYDSQKIDLEAAQNFRDGGMVRGMKGVQTSGRSFKGTY
jgi:hypothetical protein